MLWSLVETVVMKYVVYILSSSLLLLSACWAYTCLLFTVDVMNRVHRVLEKSLKVLEFGEKNSRPLKVLEKSLNLNIPYFEKFCI